MKREVKPEETSRAQSYGLWMTSPMPMVTITKTFDVSNLYKVSRRRGVKFNMLLCWCIVQAASEVEEFYTVPEGGKLYRYDKLAVDVIVVSEAGRLTFCDIPYTNTIEEFNGEYERRTRKSIETGEFISEEGAMVIGTSAIVGTEIDSITNQYTDKFCNPMVMWGKYRKSWLKVTLPISFQFHHVQMDGGHAVRFLEVLQRKMREAR
ncbi:MAG: chloramphenicol acetyltransferase [Bacteroidales bacterium]|nr:chloramphenicol acetyltransferase [Bacteroidales bacterium]